MGLAVQHKYNQLWFHELGVYACVRVLVARLLDLVRHSESAHELTG